MNTERAKKYNKLIIGYCYGLHYQKYLPVFANSVLACFNDVEILILSTDKILSEIKRQLPLYDKRLIIQENFFPLKNYGYDDVKAHISKSQFYQFLRFLIPRDLVQAYSRLYIGDLDIYYIKQLNKTNSSLFSREENIAINNNLSFNNIMRIDTLSNVTYRLGGLHYIRVNKYYDQYGGLIIDIQNNRKAFIELVRKTKINLKKNIYLKNEHLLYTMLIDNNEVDKFKKLLNKNNRELYGIHLGPLRNNKININCNYLFGKNISNRTQKVLLFEFILFLIKNKIFTYMFKYETLRLYLYFIKIIFK